MTLNEARTLVSGDQVEWIDDPPAGPSESGFGVVGFDPKNRSGHYVDWPDGQRTWLHDEPALKYMRVVKKVKSVGGLPR